MRVHTFAMIWTRCSALLWLTLFLCVSAWADDRSEIEQVYARTYRAAELKYRSGMYAHRSGNFLAYDSNGGVVDPRSESAWLDEFLASALKIGERGEIVDFRYLSDDDVECEVVDTIEAEAFADVQKTQIQQVVIVTRSLDTWKRTTTGWKQVSCRLLEQSQSTKPRGKSRR